LHETRARFDFRQRSFWTIDTARADQRKLVVHAQMGLRQHPDRRQEKRAAGQAALFCCRWLAQ